MAEHFRGNAKLVEKILKMEGVTVALLQKAIYHLRIRQGRCAVYPCRSPPEPGKTQCAKHRARGREKNRKSKQLREEIKKFNEEWDKKQVKPVVMGGTLVGARIE